jgi:hypothetical protein
MVSTAATATVSPPVVTTTPSAAVTQRIAPVAQPPAPAPKPAAVPTAHRWPTEQELASQTEDPNRTVSVATLANTAPYNPAQADVGRTNGSAARTAAPGSTPERTRNGLVKRQPKHRGGNASRPSATPAAPPSRPTSDSPVKDRTPSEVSSMLSAFRSGHQRGEQTVNGRSPIHDAPQSHVVFEEEPGDH